MQSPAQSALPTITQAHRMAAFESMHWPHCTFEAAMANDTRRRVIECRAARIRTLEWEQTQSATWVTVNRVVLGVDGHPVRWITRYAPGLPCTTKPDLFSHPATDPSHEPRNSPLRQDPPTGPNSRPPTG